MLCRIFTYVLFCVLSGCLALALLVSSSIYLHGRKSCQETYCPDAVVAITEAPCDYCKLSLIVAGLGIALGALQLIVALILILELICCTQMTKCGLACGYTISHAFFTVVLLSIIVLLAKIITWQGQKCEMETIMLVLLTIDMLFCVISSVVYLIISCCCQ